jgi:pimeloyl-ACP methyl ester carboxylesterase
MQRRRIWVLAWALVLCAVPCLRAEDKYFESSGVKIRYTEQGQGEAVLLIHGFGVNADLQWDLQGIVKALAKDYHVIAYDNRGHGKSDKPHDPKKYGGEMVEDAVRLLDHLKIKKAHVVGYSMGAMITGKLLVTHADRLQSATLGGAAPNLKDEQRAKFMEKLAISLEEGKGAGPLFEALTPAGKPRPSAEEIKNLNKWFVGMNDPKALAAVVRGFNSLVVTEDELKANRVPTLALIGADDPLKKGVDALDGHMSHLKIVVIPAADHITAPGRPEFNDSLNAFLAKHRAAGKADKRQQSSPRR